MRKKKISPAEKDKPLEPVFRKASDGLWLIILIPCALISAMKNVDIISPNYSTVSQIGVGLFIYSLGTIVMSKYQITNTNLPYTTATNCVLSSGIAALLLQSKRSYGMVFSSCIAFISVTSYHFVFKTLLSSCPKSFTYGEATIVSQSLILYLISFVLDTICYLQYEQPRSCDRTTTYILQTGYFTVFIMVVLGYYYRKHMEKLWFFTATLCILFLTFVVYLPLLVLRRNSLLWVLELLNDQISIRLIVFWIMCCAFSIYCLWKQAALNIPASSASRKNFHFAILFVLVPGLVFRPCLMYLASGVGFAILVMIEVIRKLQLSKFSAMLQSCFDVFKDSKDEGPLALTPLYLMLGCVTPFWIYPLSFENFIPLPVLSGLLSIAVGDTAASICGTTFGKHRWPGTEKTIEGTIGCVASQMLVLFSLEAMGIVQTLDMLTIYISTFVIITTSLVEAITDQIDNLVLPLVSYVLFMLLSTIV